MSAPEEPDRSPIHGRTQELLLLGEIRGLVQGLKDGQDRTNHRIDEMSNRIDTRFGNIEDRMGSMDDRLRTVEQKAAVAGALSGGAMAIGTALIIEGIKTWLRGGAGSN
ncbi:hypothetical protein BH10PSE18_BH10PSE18_18940 [soil metagenome]